MVDVERTFRRLEPLHVMFALFWGLGMLVPVLAHWFAGLKTAAVALLAVDAAVLTAIYLAAPAASIVVTPRSADRGCGGRVARSGPLPDIHRRPVSRGRARRVSHIEGFVRLAWV
ncbi:hypothetical protein O7635_07375 [Asanoa sp. WMMD1127]|uniref:hypothetical protein n=1 Tax=Asanoa sp. WMMD1127 TaxID=3016107 RepID=UPI002417A7D4|nr:hypothetical protein [Asanoa sp. WMMD1127]MDG4821672.1 hypothetical protein [Asanoa sp. WMMD1127]